MVRVRLRGWSPYFQPTTRILPFTVPIISIIPIRCKESLPVNDRHHLCDMAEAKPKTWPFGFRNQKHHQLHQFHQVHHLHLHHHPEVFKKTGRNARISCLALFVRGGGESCSKDCRNQKGCKIPSFPSHQSRLAQNVAAWNIIAERWHNMTWCIYSRLETFGHADMQCLKSNTELFHKNSTLHQLLVCVSFGRVFSFYETEGVSRCTCFQSKACMISNLWCRGGYAKRQGVH